jgi:hypothetical protein
VKQIYLLYEFWLLYRQLLTGWIIAGWDWPLLPQFWGFWLLKFNFKKPEDILAYEICQSS